MSTLMLMALLGWASPGAGPEIDPGIISMDGQPNLDEDMELSSDIEPSEDQIPDAWEI